MKNLRLQIKENIKEKTNNLTGQVRDYVLPVHTNKKKRTHSKKEKKKVNPRLKTKKKIKEKQTKKHVR